MSCKNRLKGSLDPETYHTPPWVVDQAMRDVLPVVCPMPKRIVEPSAGNGVFVSKLRMMFGPVHITAVDLLRYRWPDADESVHGNFLHCDLGRYDLAIGNPPYSLAQDFVIRCIGVADVTVLLLRQGFLASAKRNDFFQFFAPSDIFILANRPSFTDDKKTDSADYCWVCWRRCGAQFETRLRWLRPVPIEWRRGL